MGYVLYDFLSSGNGYKCRLTMKALGIPYEYRHRDIIAGETRTPEFLAINANGKIPVLVVPGEGPIAESHAIINYLAEGTKLMPGDRYRRALVWQWLCFEQYQLEPGVATVRFMLHYLNKSKKSSACGTRTASSAARTPSQSSSKASQAAAGWSATT